MDGILIIDKPEGFTSHDLVARLRRILKTRKIGHTGTLDPFATGVLVTLVGKATRLAQFLDKDEKEYEAVVRFGFETDTGDRTGSPKSQVSGPKLPTIGDIEHVLPQFRGVIEQTPPMYSAKKIDGKKLYEHARKGVEIERKPIAVDIRNLEVLSEPLATAAGKGFGAECISLRVTCSAGTYIRTLAEDIGRAIGWGAHLQELRRTRAGKFDISQSITLDELEADSEPSKRILPMTEAVGHLPEFTLTAERVQKTLNGLSTRIEPGIFHSGETVRMSDEIGELIAIGIFDVETCRIHPKIVFA